MLFDLRDKALSTSRILYHLNFESNFKTPGGLFCFLLQVCVYDVSRLLLYRRRHHVPFREIKIKARVCTCIVQKKI